MFIELTESEIADVSEALNNRAMGAYKLADEYELAGRLPRYTDAQTERGNRLSRLVGKVVLARNTTLARETPGRNEPEPDSDWCDRQSFLANVATVDLSDLAFDAKVAEINNDPEIAECMGHESTSGPAGISFYCDGSCSKGAR